MSRRLGALLGAYSAFTSCLSMNARESYEAKFEKTNMKGMSSKKMGTCGKKKSRKERKIEKRRV